MCFETKRLSQLFNCFHGVCESCYNINGGRINTCVMCDSKRVPLPVSGLTHSKPPKCTCPICLEMEHLVRPFDCRHGVCRSCADGLKARKMEICPLCRCSEPNVASVPDPGSDSDSDVHVSKTAVCTDSSNVRQLVLMFVVIGLTLYVGLCLGVMYSTSDESEQLSVTVPFSRSGHRPP
eukprot:GHVQ01034779.1.p1 GENE.GHVQ01034779.1~~GHVQ01034779.1.p1  ORF type:complete len:179 (+),score=4.63 GHVQ01034779.1:108-644(+)